MPVERGFFASLFTKDGKPVEFVNIPDPAERAAQKEAARGLFNVYRDFIEAGFSSNEAIALITAFIANVKKGQEDE